MSILARIRWSLFLLYLAVFFVVPPGLLFGTVGALSGMLGWLMFLCFLRWRAAERLTRRLGAEPLTRAEAPRLHAIVAEFCRRLEIATPELRVIASDAVNLATYGFSSGKYTLAVTRGAMDRLRPEELAALIARELSLVSTGAVGGQSWLSQFLATIDFLVGTPGHRTDARSPRVYPAELVIRQALFFPLALVPVFLLRSRWNPEQIDAKSLWLSRSASGLAEALRHVDAMKERFPLFAPFNARHLFMVAPQAADPVARLFFDGDSLAHRIATLETLRPLRTTGTV